MPAVATRAEPGAGNSERRPSPQLKTRPEKLPAAVAPGAAWLRRSKPHVRMRKVLPAMVKEPRAEATIIFDCRTSQSLLAAIWLGARGTSAVWNGHLSPRR